MVRKAQINGCEQKRVKKMCVGKTHQPLALQQRTQRECNLLTRESGFVRERYAEHSALSNGVASAEFSF
jgi:hypothetical protein